MGVDDARRHATISSRVIFGTRCRQSHMSSCHARTASESSRNAAKASKAPVRRWLKAVAVQYETKGDSLFLAACERRGDTTTGRGSTSRRMYQRQHSSRRQVFGRKAQRCRHRRFAVDHLFRCRPAQRRSARYRWYHNTPLESFSAAISAPMPKMELERVRCAVVAQWGPCQPLPSMA